MTTSSANDVMLEYYISVLKLQCEFKMSFFSKTTVRNEGTIAWVIPQAMKGPPRAMEGCCRLIVILPPVSFSVLEIISHTS